MLWSDALPTIDKLTIITAAANITISFSILFTSFLKETLRSPDIYLDRAPSGASVRILYLPCKTGLEHILIIQT